MFGVRTTQVFTSRWKAVLWAAGVMMTAYCTVPSADETDAAPQARDGGSASHDVDAQKVLRDLDALNNR